MSKAVGKMNLRPFERRLLVGVLVVLLVVINFVFIWPHFKDWSAAQDRIEAANTRFDKFSKEIAQTGEYEKKIQEFKSEGATVTAEDQANQFFRAVQNQATLSDVSLPSISRQSTRTNEFFLEQLQTFRVTAGEEQLVDFLYNLGSGESVIRVRSLSLRPNGARQQLEGSIDLVASYQKNPKKPVATTAAAPAKAIPSKTSTAKKP